MADDPDREMYTLSSCSRRLHVGDMTRDVQLEAGHTHWLPAQVHAGENIGSSDTYVLLVELKDPGRCGGRHTRAGDVRGPRPR